MLLTCINFDTLYGCFAPNRSRRETCLRDYKFVCMLSTRISNTGDTLVATHYLRDYDSSSNMAQQVDSTKTLGRLKYELDGWLLMQRDARDVEGKLHDGGRAPTDQNTVMWDQKRQGTAKNAWAEVLKEEQKKEDSIFVRWYKHRKKEEIIPDEELSIRLKELENVVKSKKADIAKLESTSKANEQSN